MQNIKVNPEIINPISNQSCGLYLIAISRSPVSFIQKPLIMAVNNRIQGDESNCFNLLTVLVNSRFP